jgi:hypothetical protein
MDTLTGARASLESPDLGQLLSAGVFSASESGLLTSWRPEEAKIWEVLTL